MLENDPAEHLLHVVLPFVEEKFPAEQSVHADAPEEEKKDPGLHGRHADEDVEPQLGLYVPGLHDVQELVLVPAILLYEPGKQEGHNASLTRPVVLEYFPAGHCVQTVARVLLA
jgi:hypothetical protein